MSSLTSKLLNPNLKTLTPYESARRLFSGGTDWLNANESPFCNELEVEVTAYNRYPDCQPQGLIDAYANYAQVKADNVLATRGADEGIELLIRTFCEYNKDSILICPPTYGMYKISAQTSGINTVEVPLKEDFSLDIEGIKAIDKVNIVFLCSPNNPTGTLLDKNDITQLLTHFADSALVVLDEAYVEFSPQQNWATLLETFPNLVVLRTLSKAFALAGLRCGFTLANPAIIQSLLKTIAPYPISAPVAQIAQKALSVEGVALMREQVNYLAEEQTRVRHILSNKAGFSLKGGTEANFILFQYTYRTQLMQYLVANGMLIRDQSKQCGLTDCLRMTIGSREQNDRFLLLIDNYLNDSGEVA
ncbi:histidinol-phosphate transaminase [Alteromonas sp. ASW11-130]|uniref:histidinol-phosphate transaminase n=1 Tax=Alteromonas sp. ASW11-130 TaxID=3015775 RepID=UPI0022422182|nr:histidinol-phosphate transaminase [Alteromonas sp. ASW11-130]MCW8092525.1 histidinol-phosphate transaminase [Alteromonas sp. ASW11-130]